MGFTKTITSTTSLTTTGSTATNLNGVLFITANAAFKTRVQEYSAWSEVTGDSYINSSSNAYLGMKLGFSQPDCGVPILLGRRQIDDATIAPSSAIDNKDYGFTIEVYDTSTNATVNTYEAYVDSGDSASLANIATALYTEIATTQAADNITVTDNSGSITINADSGYDFLLSGFENVTDTYTTTEDAEDAFAAILDENNNDWYFVAADDHTEEFVLALADAVELTKNDDYPKLYRFCTDDANSLVTLPDTAVDILGKCYEAGYTRTMGEWNHEADTIFPEMAALCLQSGKDISTNWKFMKDLYGVDGAQNTLTGKELSSTKLGYIEARNASFMATERGTTFMHGGSCFADGYWIDLQRGADYINSELETTLLDVSLDSDRGLTYTDADKEAILGKVKSVLSDAVSEGILSGYDSVSMPNISSADQIARIIDSISWVGYLAGHVNTILIDGALTYTDTELV